MSAGKDFLAFLHAARDEGSIRDEDALRISSALETHVAWNAPIPATMSTALDEIAKTGFERGANKHVGGGSIAVSSLMLKVIALAGLVAVAGGVVFVTTGPHTASPAIAPRPEGIVVSRDNPAPESAPVAAPLPTTMTISELPEVPARPMAPVLQLAPAASAKLLPPTLAEELAALDHARGLIAMAPDDALLALDAHARKYPATPFREEAALLRVEALLATGRRGDAEQIAAPYLRTREGTPFARHLRDLLAGSRATDAR